MLNFEKILEMNLVLQGEKGQDGLSRLQQLMSFQTFVVHEMLTSSVATAHFLVVLAFPRSVAIALLCFSNLSASAISQARPSTVYWMSTRPATDIGFLYPVVLA